MKQVDVLVIGAGPTGLGAATRLNQLDHKDWLLVDSNQEAGGLASTDITPEGFLFDIGGHVIFSHYEYFDRLLEEAVGKFDDPEAWVSHQRESFVRFKGQWVPYPFQNNLCRVPVQDQVEILSGMIEAKVAAAEQTFGPGPMNFDQWIVSTMGRGMANLFMRPYNYKVWAIPLSLMSWDWLGERVSVVDPVKAMENVLLNKEDKGWGPNATFAFPRHGGTGAIWKAVANKLPQDKLLMGHRLTKVDLNRKEATLVKVSNGSSVLVRYKKMLSTVPLDLLLSQIISPPEIPPQGLVYSSTRVIGLGIRGINPHGTKCWMYFPEDNCQFYRATVFSQYSPGNVPLVDKKLATIQRADGAAFTPQEPQEGPWWSLMLEVSESASKPVNHLTLVSSTIQECIHAGLLEGPEEIVSIYHRRMEHGYPTPTTDRNRALWSVLPGLQKGAGVWSRGRFGSYKYEVANQDHSLVIGVEAVDNMLFGTEETTLEKPSVVNGNKGKNPKPLW